MGGGREVNLVVSAPRPMPHDVDHWRPAVEPVVVLHDAFAQIFVVLRADLDVRGLCHPSDEVGVEGRGLA